jgi:hypothetical protein
MDTTHRILLAVPVAIAASSACLYVPTLPKDPSQPGTIRLETTEDDEPEERTLVETEQGAVSVDSDEFGAFRPESIDGVRIKGQEEVFWRRVRVVRCPACMIYLTRSCYSIDEPPQTCKSRIFAPSNVVQLVRFWMVSRQ